MSFDVEIGEVGGVIIVKVKIPFSSYVLGGRALVKPGREGLRVVP